MVVDNNVDTSYLNTNQQSTICVGAEQLRPTDAANRETERVNSHPLDDMYFQGISTDQARVSWGENKHISPDGSNRRHSFARNASNVTEDDGYCLPAPDSLRRMHTSSMLKNVMSVEDLQAVAELASIVSAVQLTAAASQASLAALCEEAEAAERAEAAEEEARLASEAIVAAAVAAVIERNRSHESKVPSRLSHATH